MKLGGLVELAYVWSLFVTASPFVSAAYKCLERLPLFSAAAAEAVSVAVLFMCRVGVESDLL